MVLYDLHRSVRGAAVKKTIVLIDLYACSKCTFAQKYNINCVTIMRRQDSDDGCPPPPPRALAYCPLSSQPCSWVYFQTKRETVKA